MHQLLEIRNNEILNYDIYLNFIEINNGSSNSIIILSNYIYRTNNIFYQFNIVPYDLQIKINTHSEYIVYGLIIVR